MFKNLDLIRFKDFKGKNSFKANVDIIEYSKDDIQKNIFNKDMLNNYFEWTDYSDKIKPFYDIDIKYYNEIIYQTDQDRIKNDFYDYCLKLFPNCEIAVSSSHGEKLDNKGVKCWAISYHFVINNYETTIEELKQFNEWNNIYNKFSDYGIDKSVYRNGGNMRALYSNKPNDNRTKIPENYKRNLFKHLITSNIFTNKEFEKIKIMDTSTSPAISPPPSPTVENKNFELPKIKEEDFKKLLFSIKPRYDYNDWIAIGHICFNNFDGSDIGFKIFNEYSEQDKNKYSGIEKLLNTYNFFKKQNPKNRLSYKQLKRWHDEDYPCKNKYEKYYKEGRLIEEMNKECFFYTATSDIIYIINDEIIVNKSKIAELKYKKYMFSIENPNANSALKYIKVNPFNLWLEHIDRKDIDKIVFDPSTTEEKENVFNTWSGYKYNHTDEDIDMDKIKDFLFHIKDVIANNDESQSEYILNWISHIIQMPYKRTNTCLVFSSIQGVGKTIIIDLLGKMIGKDYYLSTNSLDAVLGHFTSSGANKLLVNFNETNWGGDVKMEGKFKSFITDDMYKLEKKGKDPIYINNLANSIISSNKDWLVAMTRDDRRFNLMECKNEKLSKEKALKILDTDLQHLFNYFMNRDISNFDPSVYKRSEFAEKQIELNYDSVQVFWKNFIYGESKLDKEKFICKIEMYDTYISECVATHVHKLNNVKFWIKIRKLCPSLKFHKASGKNKPKIELPEDDILIQEFENATY
jgi:hypothetical protein